MENNSAENQIETTNAVVTPPPPVFPNFTMAMISGIKLPLAVRINTSDEVLIKTIFTGQEYLVPIENFQPKLIIDCGANVGYSAVFFANQYPAAKIIAVEPELMNYKMLTYNTNFYDSIYCIRSAIWNKETFVEVKDVGLGAWGFMTFDAASNADALPATTVSKLLASSGFDSIDLLKVDIEGAEKEVFGADDVHDWLSKTKVIAIEIHDRMKRGCAMAVFGAVSKYNFYYTQRGENLFFIREELLN